MAAVSDLAAHMGYLLRMVSNAVSHEFARKVTGDTPRKGDPDRQGWGPWRDSSRGST